MPEIMTNIGCINLDDKVYQVPAYPGGAKGERAPSGSTWDKNSQISLLLAIF